LEELLSLESESHFPQGAKMKTTLNYVTTKTGLNRNPNRDKDIRLLHELLPTLGDQGILAIYFRFWEQLLIEDIAKIIGLSWTETDQLIEASIKELRAGFLKNQLSLQQVAA
jgi:DNA-directed RNA polymerase specialized sigma subunit